MKKKLIIYMETAAIFKIINEPSVFGNSTTDLGIWCFDSGILQGDVFLPVLYYTTGTYLNFSCPF